MISLKFNNIQKMLKPEFKSLYLQSSLFFSLWSSTFGFPWITVHLNAHSEDNYYWLLTKLILIEDIGAGSVFAEVQVAQFVLQNWNKPWVKKKCCLRYSENRRTHHIFRNIIKYLEFAQGHSSQAPKELKKMLIKMSTLSWETMKFEWVYLIW